MERIEELPTRSLMELLPPVEVAPILEKLARLGLKKFTEEHALDSPQDKNGKIDTTTLIEETTAQIVDPLYRWKGTRKDRHHVVFYKADYQKDQHNGNVYPSRYRELQVHKLWVLRSWHVFDHVIRRHPFMPEVDYMETTVRDYRTANGIHQVICEVLSRETASGSGVIVDLHHPIAERTRLLDKIEAHVQSGVYPNLEQIAGTRLTNRDEIEQSLETLKVNLGDILGRTDSVNGSIVVHLPSEI